MNIFNMNKYKCMITNKYITKQRYLTSTILTRFTLKYKNYPCVQNYR